MRRKKKSALLPINLCSDVNRPSVGAVFVKCSNLYLMIISDSHQQQ